MYDALAWRNKSAEEQEAGIEAGNPVAMYYRALDLINRPGWSWSDTTEEKHKHIARSLNSAFDLLRDVLNSKLDLPQEVQPNQPIKSAFNSNKNRARNLLSNTLHRCTYNEHRLAFTEEEKLGFIRESAALDNNVAKNELANQFLRGEIKAISPDASETTNQKTMALALLVEAYVAEGINFGRCLRDLDRDAELLAAYCESEIKRGLTRHPYSIGNETKSGFSRMKFLAETEYGDDGFPAAQAALNRVSDFIDDRSQRLASRLKQHGKILTDEWYKREKDTLAEAKAMIGPTLGALRKAREAECDIVSEHTP